MDDFALVKAIDRRRQSGVVTITNTADGWLDPNFCKAFGIFDRNIVAAVVTVVDQDAR